MEVPKKLKDEIWDYCRSNDITDVNGFMVRLLEEGFNVEKYGEKPTFDVGSKEPQQPQTSDEDKRPDNEAEDLKKELVDKESKITELEQQILDLNHKLEEMSGSGKEDEKENNKRTRNNLYDDEDIEASSGSNVYDDLNKG